MAAERLSVWDGVFGDNVVSEGPETLSFRIGSYAVDLKFPSLQHKVTMNSESETHTTFHTNQSVEISKVDFVINRTSRNPEQRWTFPPEITRIHGKTLIMNHIANQKICQAPAKSAEALSVTMDVGQQPFNHTSADVCPANMFDSIWVQVPTHIVKRGTAKIATDDPDLVQVGKYDQYPLATVVAYLPKDSTQFKSTVGVSDSHMASALSTSKAIIIDYNFSKVVRTTDGGVQEVYSAQRAEWVKVRSIIDVFGNPLAPQTDRVKVYGFETTVVVDDGVDGKEGTVYPAVEDISSFFDKLFTNDNAEKGIDGRATSTGLDVILGVKMGADKMGADMVPSIVGIISVHKFDSADNTLMMPDENMVGGKKYANALRWDNDGDEKRWVRYDLGTLEDLKRKSDKAAELDYLCGFGGTAYRNGDRRFWMEAVDDITRGYHVFAEVTSIGNDRNKPDDALGKRCVMELHAKVYQRAGFFWLDKRYKASQMENDNKGWVVWRPVDHDTTTYSPIPLGLDTFDRSIALQRDIEIGQNTLRSTASATLAAEPPAADPLAASSADSSDVVDAFVQKKREFDEIEKSYDLARTQLAILKEAGRGVAGITDDASNNPQQLQQLLEKHVMHDDFLGQLQIMMQDDAAETGYEPTVEDIRRDPRGAVFNYVQKLRGSLDTRRSTLAAKEQRIGELEDNVQRLEAERARVQQELDKEIADRRADVSRLEGELSTQQQQAAEALAAATTKINELSANLGLREASIQSLKSDVANKNTHIDELTQDRDRRAQTVTVKERELAARERSIADLESRLTSETAAKEEVQRELRTAKADIKTLRDSLASEQSARQRVETELEAEQRAKADVELALGEMRTEKERLEAELATTRQTLEDVTGQLATANAEIREKVNEVARLKERIAGLERDKEALETQKAQQEETIRQMRADMERERSEAEAEKTRLQNEVDAFKSQIEQLQATETGLRDAMETLERELYSERDTVRQTGSELAAKQEESKRVTGELESARVTHEALKARFAAAEDERARRQQELEEFAAALVARVDESNRRAEGLGAALRDRIEGLKQEVARKAKQIEALKRDRADDDARLKAQLGTIEDMRRALEASKERMLDREGRQQALDQRIAALQQQLRQADNRFGSPGSEQRAVDMGREIQSLREALARAQAERDQFVRDMAKQQQQAVEAIREQEKQLRALRDQYIEAMANGVGARQAREEMEHKLLQEQLRLLNGAAEGRAPAQPVMPPAEGVTPELSQLQNRIGQLEQQLKMAHDTERRLREHYEQAMAAYRERYRKQLDALIKERGQQMRSSVADTAADMSLSTKALEDKLEQMMAVREAEASELRGRVGVVQGDVQRLQGQYDRAQQEISKLELVVAKLVKGMLADYMQMPFFSADSATARAAIEQLKVSTEVAKLRSAVENADSTVQMLLDRVVMNMMSKDIERDLTTQLKVLQERFTVFKNSVST